MSTLVRVDRVSGYKWVDWYVDQAGRWNETVTWWPGDPNVGLPVDVTGYSARLIVIRAGLDTTPVLDLSSPGDITVGGSAGTFSWDVHAGPMSTLVHPVYQHELILMPGGEETLGFPLLKGRVLVRASVLTVAVPPVVPGAGWGHGLWGHFPWGH